MELEELGYLPQPKGLVIEGEIARGAYCTVHRGTLDGKPVAVKKIQKILLEAASPIPSIMFDMKRRFIRARNLLSLDHPGIVNIIGAYYDKQTGEPMLVMELMEKSLRDYQAEVKGRLSVAEQCMMCRDITSALVYLHQQDPPIVYCDLTNHNILISFDGQVKLGACGEAQRKPPGGYFVRGPGAPMYIPPEAFHLKDARYDEKIDVFSLGVVMFETALQPHFFGLKGHQIELSRIPPDHPLKPIIFQCVQTNQVDRPNSVTVLKKLKKICPVSQRKFVTILYL